MEREERGFTPNWVEAMFGQQTPDSKYGHLLALACSLILGNPEVAHHFYRTARQAGADDEELQNVTELASQAAGHDLSGLAWETVWRAPDDAWPPVGDE